MKINHEYEVLTSNGFKDFKGIKESKRMQNIRLTFNDGTKITTTPEHKLKVNKSIYRKVQNIKIKNKVQNKKIINIEYNILCSNLFYDLIDVAGGNHYTTSGVESHNCAYISPNDIKDFEDSVLATVTSVPNSQIFKSSTAKGRNHWYFDVKGSQNNIFSYKPKTIIEEIGMTAEEAYKAKYKDNKHIIEITKKDNIYEVKKHKGKNGYKIVEANYLDRYKGDPEGAAKFKREIIAEKDAVFFQQVHANEFLGSSYTLINDKVLADITAKDDEDIIRDTLFDGLRIFEEPKPNRHYIIGVDPKKSGIDSVGVQVLDVTEIPFIQVATAEIDESFLVVPGRLFDLGNYYNEALVVCENNIGESIPTTLFYNYEYEGEVFIEVKADGSEKKEMGFRTTVKSKRLGLTLLKKLIEESKLIINDQDTLEQLFVFVEHKNGTFSAEEDSHDDLVMSLMVSLAPFLNFKNFDDFKGFINYIDKKQTDQESKDSELEQFLSLGFNSNNISDELPFTKALWENEEHYFNH